MLLAADVGGTKTVIAEFDSTGDRPLRPVRAATFESRSDDSLE